MGLSMAYHPHHHVHSAAAVAAAAAHQHSSGGPSYMDHFSNSAALSAAAAASAVSGSPPGSGSGSSYSNQAAVQAAIGSSLHQTPTVSSPSSYSVNQSSGNLGNSSGVGTQQPSASPTSNISHNNSSAALLASQVSVVRKLYASKKIHSYKNIACICNMISNAQLVITIYCRSYLLITTRLYHLCPRLVPLINYMASITKVTITNITHLKVTREMMQPHLIIHILMIVKLIQVRPKEPLKSHFTITLQLQDITITNQAMEAQPVKIFKGNCFYRN